MCNEKLLSLAQPIINATSVIDIKITDKSNMSIQNTIKIFCIKVLRELTFTLVKMTQFSTIC